MSWIWRSKAELSTSPIFNELVISKDGEVAAMQINLYNLDDYSQAIKEMRSIINSNQFLNVFGWSSNDSG